MNTYMRVSLGTRVGWLLLLIEFLATMKSRNKAVFYYFFKIPLFNPNLASGFPSCASNRRLLDSPAVTSTSASNVLLPAVNAIALVSAIPAETGVV